MNKTLSILYYRGHINAHPDDMTNKSKVHWYTLVMNENLPKKSGLISNALYNRRVIKSAGKLNLYSLNKLKTLDDGGKYDMNILKAAIIITDNTKISKI